MKKQKLLSLWPFKIMSIYTKRPDMKIPIDFKQKEKKEKKKVELVKLIKTIKIRLLLKRT